MENDRKGAFQPGWKESLLSLSKNLSGSEVRHGLPFVPVYILAEQFYCELKVDHYYTRGEIPTAAKQEGTVLHDELIAMEKTTLPTLIESIETRPVCLASFPLGAKVGNITVAGGRIQLSSLGGNPGS